MEMRKDMDELLRERYELSIARIREICGAEETPEPFRSFFAQEAEFLVRMDGLRREIADGALAGLTLEELRAHNRALYEEVLPGRYESCWGNPAWAVRQAGEAYGQILSFLYTELRGMVVFAYEQRLWDMEIGFELFLELYHMFAGEELPEPKYLRERIYWYASDYAGELMEQNVRELTDPSQDFAVRIIMESDLNDLRYLYRYGEYVTESEERTAAFLNTLPPEEISAMASTFTEGYRMGFVLGHKPLEKKRTVNIRYVLGFERLVREEILQFRQMGLAPVIYRSAVQAVRKSRRGRIGYWGAVPNPQFDYDHKNDAALFFDKDFMKRKLRAMQNAFEAYREQAAVHGGPAVMEVFGEEPFVPESCPEAIRFSKEQQKLLVQYDNEAGQITNRYMIGEERSFAIIAYPVPGIGERFEEIFRETVKLNTLDYQKYQRIQQTLIEALDRGVCVLVRGRGQNRTDLTVRLHPLEDAAKQTNFENCVADVNIPVGEVFTSPLLEGTNGTLHVSQVFLGELNYIDLEIKVENGMVKEYACRNFESEEENRRYISENILFGHPSVPMGEFAVGTNTTAYRMAKTYGIAGKLPILIAEKMGPHFAFGDTCYSWQEDTPVYNPDGREIIARDNEVSILRKTDREKAYFGCHTDITIPYDELGYIRVRTGDGELISIIEDGKFVLPGTEELNGPLEEEL